MAAPLAPVELIERSRRAEPVDAQSVESFVRAWLDGTASDALMAAWLMVACLRGLGAEQAGALARALVASGDRLELASLGPTGDPQSTGGVGDTTPLVAAPLAASLGVRVASLGSLSLAHAGGTIDKLEAIPGFEPDLSLAGFVRQVRDVGIAVVASDPRLVPGDRRLRALRDATATGVSGGLVAASVVSTAIAGGAGAVHVDVKAGSGGLVGDADEARAAAALMADMAGEWGRALRWTVSDGELPLGRCVGNALEVGEAGAVLRGEGPDDLRELAEEAAGALAEAAQVVPAGEGRERAAAALRQGDALAMAERWIEAQEGDPAVWTEEGALPSAPFRFDVDAPGEGRVEAIAARGVGEVARWLGVGRLHADQSIDPVVGIEILVRPGDPVGAGDPLAVVHARDEWAGERAAQMLAPAFRIGAAGTEPGPVILARGPAGA
jgi:pyrimidine-nucleoside phosphorylase